MKLHIPLALAAIIGALSVSSQAGAAGIVIGAPGDQPNCIPFTCSFWKPEYQQIYSASAFPGPIEIKEITFYDHFLANGGAVSGGDFRISLSATSTPVNGLSWPDLENNIGADNTVVFDGALPSPAGDELKIHLSTPFVYNPSAGNLLLDLYSTNATDAPCCFGYDANGSTSGLFSRAYSYGNDNNFGLVTGFNTSVPEPATWAMLILGVAMIGFAARRRGDGVAVTARSA